MIEAKTAVGEIVKEFNHGGRTWAIVRGSDGQSELMRVAKDGELRIALGTERTSRAAFEYALRKWPEYLDRPRTGE